MAHAFGAADCNQIAAIFRFFLRPSRLVGAGTFGITAV